MTDFIIPANTLQELHLDPNDLRIDLAVFLYDQGKISMGRARKLAELTQIDFQKAMMQRGVHIKYDVSDLEKDIATIQSLQDDRS